MNGLNVKCTPAGTVIPTALGDRLVLAGHIGDPGAVGEHGKAFFVTEGLGNSEMGLVSQGTGHQSQRNTALSCELRDMVMAACADNNVTLDARFRLEREDWVQAMVLSRIGFAFMCSVTLPDLLQRPLIEPEVSRTISLLSVRGRPYSPATAAMARAVAPGTATSRSRRHRQTAQLLDQ